MASLHGAPARVCCCGVYSGALCGCGLIRDAQLPIRAGLMGPGSKERSARSGVPFSSQSRAPGTRARSQHGGGGGDSGLIMNVTHFTAALGGNAGRRVWGFKRI